MEVLADINTAKIERMVGIKGKLCKHEAFLQRQY